MNFPTNICPCSQQINMSLQNLLYVLEFLTEGVYWTWWEGTHPLAPFCWEASDWAVFGPPVGILCTTGSSRNNWAILSVRSHPPLSPHSCASVFSPDICLKKKTLSNTHVQGLLEIHVVQCLILKFQSKSRFLFQ